MASESATRAKARTRPGILRRQSLRDALGKAIAYLIVITGSIVMAAPFAWMVSTSLKHPSQVFAYPPQWIPNPVMWSNYVEAFRAAPFLLYFKNSLLITVIGTIGVLVSASMAGYSFARLRWPGRNVIFLILLATLMLPSQVTMIPTFILFRHLGWVDTFLPLTVPEWFGGGPGGAFTIFLFRQFFMTLPVELEEAARVDGASSWQIYSRIMMPLSRPVIATVTVFQFLGHWNEFLTPLIYLNSPKRYTLQLGLEVFRGDYTTAWGLLMAASTAIIIPCIIVFFLAQKQFIKGIVFSGMKG